MTILVNTIQDFHIVTRVLSNLGIVQYRSGVGYFEGLWGGLGENIGVDYLGELKYRGAKQAILEASLGGVFEGLEGLHVNLAQKNNDLSSMSMIVTLQGP